MVRQVSDKEIPREQVMAQLVDGKLDQRLGIGIREVKRWKRGSAALGMTGLISKRRVRPSRHTTYFNFRSPRRARNVQIRSNPHDELNFRAR